jgi:signal transduction histidine kinase
MLINRHYQGRLVITVLAFGFLACLFNGLLFYNYVDGHYTTIFADGHLPSAVTESLEQDLKHFAIILLMLSLIAFCCLAFYLLVITHRAAGAAYHIHRVIKEIQIGKLSSRIHLREKDEYQELAESFNALMDQMQQEPKKKENSNE